MQTVLAAMQNDENVTIPSAVMAVTTLFTLALSVAAFGSDF
jgi:hypothetical protein